MNTPLTKINPSRNHETSFGLALSGGGARGLAHIGVLKALERARLKPGFLAGTSMGGVIAAAYAAGLTPHDIEQIAADTTQTRNLIRLADLQFPQQAVFRGERLLAFFDQHLHGLTFAELEIPLVLVSVDLNTGQVISLQEGSVAQALRATVSVPGLLAPVEQDGMRLVDGGLLNNLPVDVVKQMGADVVMGVDVSMHTDFIWQSLLHLLPHSAAISNLNQALGDSLGILFRQQGAYESPDEPSCYLVQPDIPAGVTTVTGFHRVAELVALGEEAVCPVLPALEEILKTPWDRDYPGRSSPHPPKQRGGSFEAGWAGNPLQS